jgi:hypothetical protein
MKMKLLIQSFVFAIAPIMLLAQNKPRERVCNTNVKEVTEVYSLVATTMHRWLREEGRLRISDGTTNRPAARHDVRFSYTTTTRKACFRKTCVWVRQNFQYEWTKKNNLVLYKRLRKPKTGEWDFKAGGFFAGRKVKVIFSVKDLAAKADYKVLAFSGGLFRQRGIVVVERTDSEPFKDIGPILIEIKKYGTYYRKDAKLVEIGGPWTRHPL